MTKQLAILFLFLAIFPNFCFGECCENSTAYKKDSRDLFYDLMIVDYWNKKINDRMPVTYDHFLQGGYFNMPSARMGKEGEIGGGFSYVPPYRNYNFRVQLIDRLEVSGNYRVFIGVDDPILTPLGFGDLSDKGANVKFALIHPEDSNYRLPGLAFGFQDFIGTRNFKSRYVVLTQVFIEQNVELSLGYGKQRIKNFFGGISWMPFRQTDCSFLNGISLVAEYDATPYKNAEIEKHPKGRKKKSSINYGFKYRLWNLLDFSLCYVRGCKLAASASTYYNFGYTKGFIPKIDDPLPYQSPVNIEPIGWRRPEDAMVQDLNIAFDEQGFELLEVRMAYTCIEEKVLKLTIVNDQYRLVKDVRDRLNYLLAYLIPADINYVYIIIESDGFPVQEYHYNMLFVRDFGDMRMGPQELEILSPVFEVSERDCIDSVLFQKKREWFNFELLPKTNTFFGSSKGKFKYAIGINADFNGFLPGDIYYSVRLGCIFLSDLHDLSGVDRLNPSQLINVHTDVVRYYQQKGITFDEFYLQKNWNMGKGWFSRLAIGNFEEEYGGIGTEFLYYPVRSLWAFGFEGAVLRKRSLRGLGYTDKVRKLHGFVPTYQKFLGSQYFVNLYYDWQIAKIDLKVQAGKFLANDVGARFEVSRKFDSGLRITFWYTYTNGNDVINGQTYHDKGVLFSMPLDIFYTHSDRSLWHYGLAAWLRDVGYSSFTGKSLHYLINEERE